MPDLFSYLQHVIDDSREPGRFILTGSQNFLLSKAVGQSLAGRVALFTLLPLSYRELSRDGLEPMDGATWVLRGGYPRLFDSGLSTGDFFPSYIKTYLERDVREELGVRALSDFSNARKRLIKSPKLYFVDTGLACSLTGIEGVRELAESPSYGHLFENAVIAEALKLSYAQGREPTLAFWRDSNKNEIDLLVEKGLRAVKAIEIKSSATYKSSYFDALAKIAPDLGLQPDACDVIYGGEDRVNTTRGTCLSFHEMDEVLV